MQTRKEKYREYLKSPNWELLRDFARFRNKRLNNGKLRCDDCEKINQIQYDVHHTEYPSDYWNDDHPKYHIVLCHRCHGIAHNKIELSEKEIIDRDKRSSELMIQAMEEMLKGLEDGC